MKRRALLVVALVLAAVGLSPRGSARAESADHDERLIGHVLNRVAFGPRASDIAHVRAIGVDKYLDEQLHPERIPDGAVAARLEGLTTIGMSSREIAEKFERPLMEEQRQRKQAATEPAAGGDQGKPPDPVQQRANRVVLELSEQKLIRAIYSERQLQEVLTDFWFNHFNVDARKGVDRFLLTDYEREVIRPHVLGKFRDLLGATAKSPAMLFYLDNWMSVDPNGPHPDPRALRPRVVRGPFGGMYVMPPPMPQNSNGQNPKRGLNENYGRELMELHTLGVDGGYTQHDVTEVARAFTGWTIQNPREGRGFKFEPRLHDMGQKVVLGHVIKAGGGEEDGEQVLDILAKQPATARFIATKLVSRFVSDTPPATLVNRAAIRFQETNGDLREVMRTILTSPEFSSADAYRAKAKTPFEFVVSAVRATGADVSDAMPLVRALQQLGMPLYQCQPPTGYKDTAEWINTGALITRMNFALALASGRLMGISADGLQATVTSQQDDYLDFARVKLVETLLGNDVSATTLGTIAKATNVPQMAALTLGAPEFQKR